MGALPGRGAVHRGMFSAVSPVTCVWAHTVHRCCAALHPASTLGMPTIVPGVPQSLFFHQATEVRSQDLSHWAWGPAVGDMEATLALTQPRPTVPTAAKVRPVHHRHTRYQEGPQTLKLQSPQQRYQPGALEARGRDVSPKLTRTLGLGCGFSPASVLKNLLEADMESPEVDALEPVGDSDREVRRPGGGGGKLLEERLRMLSGA